MVVCRLWREDAQTDRTYHRHGCGGDSDALTCGVAAPQAMVGAKAAWRHGRTPNTKIIKEQGDDRDWYNFYVGIDHVAK